jgi:hypothetical protein
VQRLLHRDGPPVARLGALADLRTVDGDEGELGGDEEGIARRQRGEAEQRQDGGQ